MSNKKYTLTETPLVHITKEDLMNETADNLNTYHYKVFETKADLNADWENMWSNMSEEEKPSISKVEK